MEKTQHLLNNKQVSYCNSLLVVECQVTSSSLFTFLFKKYKVELFGLGSTVPESRFYQDRVSLDIITRRVHCKFNCITVNFDMTQHGIYMIQNFIMSIINHVFLLYFALFYTFYDLKGRKKLF